VRVILIILLTTACWSQVTVKGVKITGVSINTPGTPPVQTIAQLPQAWANDQTCNPPGGTYDVTKTIPGSYPATWAGINNAMTDWVAAADQWWHVVITHGTLITGNSSLTMLAKPVGAGMPTKCIVFESDTPLTVGQTVCTHGIQDNLSQSTDPGIRNPDCNATGMSYQLGTTITTVGPGAFTLANGTMTNTSAYNDVSSMYTLETATVNGSAIKGGNADVNGNGPNHIVIRDAEVRLSNTIACCVPISMGNNSSTVAGMPHDYGFDRVWVHGDATDAGAGTNSLSNDIQFDCGKNCWVVNSQISKSIRPGAEGHGIYWIGAQQAKIVHNWIDGTSIPVFDGGVTGTTPVGVSAVNIEVRRNRFTYPWAWLGNGQGAGSVCGVNISCVRKNSFELKGCNQCLMAGNIFENSDNSGGQAGRVVGLNNRACTPNPCDNYVQTMANITFETNVVRHGCAGIGYDANSDGTGNGASASTPGRNVTFQNNLVYDIGLRSSWSCPTNAFTLNVLSGSHSFTVTSVTRNNTGTIATIQLAGGVGENQTGLVAGDPITLSGCTDTTFNVATYPFTTAATVSGTTITYANAGTANATTTCTSFSNGTGWPNFALIQHNTLVGDAWISSPGGGSRERNLTLINNVMTGTTGWSTLGGSDGTAFESANLDTTTLTAHHNMWADRNAALRVNTTVYRLGDVMAVNSPTHNYLAVTNGTSGSSPSLSGGLFSCAVDGTVTWQENGTKISQVGGLPAYTEYATIGVGTSPPTTFKFPATAYTFGASAADGKSVGFSGALNAPTTGTNFCGGGTQVSPSVNSAIDLNDWHGYKLDASSVAHNAGSDGQDMGANFTAIDSAQTATQYVCQSYCGSGPTPD